MRRIAVWSLALVAVVLAAMSSPVIAQEPMLVGVAPTPPPGGITVVVPGTSDILELIDAQTFAVESVWKLDIATQVWLSFTVGAPSFANSLESLDPSGVVSLKRVPTPLPSASATLIMNGHVLVDGAPVVGAELQGGYNVSFDGGGRFEALVTVTTGSDGEYSFELPWATVEDLVLPGGPIMIFYLGSDTLPCYSHGGAPPWLIVETPGTYTLDANLVVVSTGPCVPHN